MSVDAWTVVGDTLHRAFPDTPQNTWDPARSLRAYRLILGDVEPERVIAALRSLALSSEGRWRPSAGAILAALRSEERAARPTFEEACRLIFGRGGVLRAQPQRRQFADAGERARAVDYARRQRLTEIHPLVAEFARRQGLEHLAVLPFEDPESRGVFARKDLREAWDRHVAAFDGREVAALASGREARSGLRLLDPLAALGVGSVGELEAGDAA